MELVFTFSSTNYAIKAEQAVLAANIPVRVMSLPSAIDAGCGLCLRIEEELYPQVANLLADNQVKVMAVYLREMVDGKNRYRLYTKG